MEKEEERRTEEELQKKRERVLLDDRKRKRISLLNRYVESECFVVVAVVVFLSTVVAISLICLNVWLTFIVTLLFSEEEGTRNGKEEERKRREG